MKRSALITALMILAASPALVSGEQEAARKLPGSSGSKGYLLPTAFVRPIE